MPNSSFTSAESLLTYSLLLPHLKKNAGHSPEALDAATAGEENVTGRLYFTTTEAQLLLSQQNPSLVVASLRSAIAQAEQRQCPLHRVTLAPEADMSLGVAEAHTILYAERTDVVTNTRSRDAGDSVSDGEVCEAILTSCPQVFERDLPPEQCYRVATSAPLCIVNDMSASSTKEEQSTFWSFLRGVLVSGVRAGTSAATVAGVRGTLVPVFETAEATPFCADVFDDLTGVEAGHELNSQGRKKIMAVDNQESADAAVAHMQRAVVAADKMVGCTHLVVEVTMRRVKQIRATSAGGTSPRGQQQQQQQPDTRICLVWLRNPTLVMAADGVYADVALEMLLDELALAAASTFSSDSAAGVLAEPGLQQFVGTCQLTTVLHDTIAAGFAEACRRERPMFHWMVSAPPSRTSRLDGRVTRRTFSSSASACADDFWCSMEVLEHWKDVATVLASLPVPLTLPTSATTPLQSPTRSGGSVTPELEGSMTSLSASLRERARLSRNRRAARQGGHAKSAVTTSPDAPVSGRSARKPTLPPSKAAEALAEVASGNGGGGGGGGASAEISKVPAPAVHPGQSSLNSSVSGTSLFDSEELMGASTRRTVRLVKRIAKPKMTTDEL